MEERLPQVLFLMPTWEVNGVSSVNFLLAEGLSEMGYECAVIGTDLNQDDPPVGLIPPGVQHLRLTRRPLARRLLGLRRPALIRASCLIDRALSHLLRNARRTVLVPGFELGWTRWSEGLPSQVSVLGIIHSDDPWWYEAASILSRHTQHLVTVSHRIQEQLWRRLPHWSGTIHHIPNGVKCPEVPPERNRRPGEPLRLLYAGRLVEQQKRISRIPYLLRALEGAGVAFQMEIAGEGAEEGQLREACQNWVNTDRVRFLGRLSSEEVRAACRRADVFVLLSDFEGLPMGLLEAMSEGCVPLVSEGVGGLDELVGDTGIGWLVHADNLAGHEREFWQKLTQAVMLLRGAERAWGAIKGSHWESNTMLERYRSMVRALSEC